MDNAMFKVQTYLNRRSNLKTRIESGVSAFTIACIVL